jgi:hypothetical protein
MQPLVAGLLLAVAAGALALSLARVLLFALGGAACAWLAHTVAPAWDAPAVYFLVGGLLGVLFYRVWVTALFSLAGTLLLAYSILGLLGAFAVFDVVAWAGDQAAILNWVCVAIAALGLLAQLLLARRRRRRQRERELEEQEAGAFAYGPPRQPRRWWEWGQKKGPKRAA